MDAQAVCSSLARERNRAVFIFGANSEGIWYDFIDCMISGCATDAQDSSKGGAVETGCSGLHSISLQACTCS